MADEAGQWHQRVALITGSSSGIGAATACLLAARGATVVVNSSRSAEAGERLAADIRGHYIRADVGDADGARKLVADALDRCGRLDALVNNAGRTALIPLDDLDGPTVDTWNDILGLNVIGTWNVIQAAMPALRSAGGAIVNVSSVAGTRPAGSSIPYATSKAALDHLTRLVAKVAGPQVRCNGVAPGLVDTPWTADWHDAREAYRAAVPLRMSGSPDDVARVIADVLEWRYVTGAVVTVDGGASLL